jgi:acyl-coenzyme A thioesterase PaaI-like protein
LPGGTWLFSHAIGHFIPYSGSIRPHVLELRPGFARIRIQDRRAVRNHLRSVHAIALMNLAELTTGLALSFGLPDDARAILAGLSIEFTKKSRGPIESTVDCGVPDSSERKEHPIESTLRDASGDIVARATARWLVAPRTSPS